MKVERALRELGQLGEAAGDGELRDRMVAQIFEQPAGEIAHVEQRDVGERVALPARPASEVLPVEPATWSSPAARATSMPLWIEWIQAEQEKGTTMPVVPRIESPPTMPRRGFQVFCASASPPGMEISISASARDAVRRRDLLDRLRHHPARHRIDRRLARRDRQARQRHRADALARP